MSTPLSPVELQAAIATESQEMERTYRWLENHMPAKFFEEVVVDRFLVARNLMSFQLQDKFSAIHLKHMAIVLCMDGTDADLKILKAYSNYAIRYYRAFVSNAPPPNERTGALRIAILHFREEPKQAHGRDELLRLIQETNLAFREKDLETLVHAMTPRLVRSLAGDRLTLAINMYFRAKTRDECQYEIRRNENWQETGAPSLQIVLAWRAAPKSGFLYRLAKVIYNHGLELKRVVASHIDPYETDSVLLLSIGVHGLLGKAAWEEANIDDFLREMALLKYFNTEDEIAEIFVKTGLLSGNEAHLVRNFISFTHQALLHVDPHLYSLTNVSEGFCRHPELTAQLCKLFEAKFDPKKHNLHAVEELHKAICSLIEKLDTGHAMNDARRKNILKAGVHFIQYTLKTNFYRHNKTGFSFRLDPKYLGQMPQDLHEKFPELPFGIFFIRGMHFLGFNIRFKDLARGGVRTVAPDRQETYWQERNHIFAEAYNLAYTQQKKNKDIPEGGAKTAILLAPYEMFQEEEAIFVQEMEMEGMDGAVLEERLKMYRRDHKLAFLHASQRSFIESLMTLVNCDENGTLRARDVIDYWKQPEYIYLGPDENMHNEMIVWISDFSVRCNYQPGRSFMSSKPGAGINHKEYGVTSLGLNVYVYQTLLSLGIHPEKEPFTVKISGGPDGDVAGNEIHLLATKFPKTAKLLALTDVSGTIFDPEGLDWTEMDSLFKTGKTIRHYPPEKLHEGGFLLDLQMKRDESAYAQQTLLWRKTKQGPVQEWLSGNEMNQLFRNNVHQVKSDLFIPCGGRPRTLNELNVENFLDENRTPTAKAIVEGANLYLTDGARKYLEALNTIVLKDSSCNKGGVICSSFEVIAGLCLTEEEFAKVKKEYVREVLEIIQQAALSEAELILKTHKHTATPCTELSEKVSERINLFKYQLMSHFERKTLPTNPKDPLIHCLLLYCPPLLQKQFPDRILKMPEIHKKAIISVFLASRLVYTRGLEWSPSVADVLSIVATDPHIIGTK